MPEMGTDLPFQPSGTEVERLLAQSRGVQELCLLTTTAEHFFERLGYQRAEREAAPASIRGTSEFTTLCPASAVFMRKRLRR